MLNLKRLSFEDIEKYQKYILQPYFFIAITYHCNLRCPYCYAEGLKKVFQKDMAIDNFKRIVNWIKKQGKNKIIILTGGEPTVHPRFIEFLDICKKANIKICVLTNNLFNSKVAEKISDGSVASVVVHFNNPEAYTREEYKVFKRNLNMFYENREKFYSFQFRYIIPMENESFADIIKHAKKHSAPIRVSFANPGFSKNRHVNFKSIGRMKNTVLKFVGECEKNDVFSFFARPVPRCMFDDKQWNYLERAAIIRSECLVGYDEDYAPRLVVNPDLSIFPCLNVFYRGPNILGFKDLMEVSKFYQEKFKSLRSKPIIKKCEKCKYHINGECQGGCLSYKLKGKGIIDV